MKTQIMLQAYFIQKRWIYNTLDFSTGNEFTFSIYFALLLLCDFIFKRTGLSSNCASTVTQLAGRYDSKYCILYVIYFLSGSFQNSLNNLWFDFNNLQQLGNM